MTQPVVELSCITKTYPGVVANDCVSLALGRGEVVGMLGENGAGKTTLMGVLYGLIRPDSGQIRLDGRRVSFHSPRDAIGAGIGMVPQYFALIPTLTVAENIALSAGNGSRLLLHLDQIKSHLSELSQRYSLDVPVEAVIEDLPVGVQQRVELLRVLYRSCRILILDEPTALLTPQESRDLAKVLRSLAATGVSIFFVSHKLEETVELCDRIAVLRRGRLVGTVSGEDATPQMLAEMMIGYVPDQPSAVQQAPDQQRPRLSMKNVWVRGARGTHSVKGVSFTVHAGEIVGIAGLEGSGQVELCDAVAGLREVESGDIVLDGRTVTRLGPRQRATAGLAYIPPDRRQWGLVLDFDIALNIALRTYLDPTMSKWGLLDNAAMYERASELMRRFDVRATSPKVLVAALSGGNQQKVVLARELSSQPKVLVSCHATRGLDVAAAAAVQEEVLRRRSEGAAVLYVSTELDELLSMSDRLLVMHGGQIVGSFAGAGKVATAEEVGLLMGGRKAVG